MLLKIDNLWLKIGHSHYGLYLINFILLDFIYFYAQGLHAFMFFYINKLTILSPLL